MSTPVAEAVRAERTRRGLSQKQVAQAAYVSSTTVSFTENSRPGVSRHIKATILQVLGLNPGDFPELQDNKPSKSSRPRRTSAPATTPASSARKQRPAHTPQTDQGSANTKRQHPNSATIE